MDRFICVLSVVTILVIGFQEECQARPGYSPDYSSEYKDYEEYEEEPPSYYLDESVSQEEHVLNQDGYGENYVYGDSRISSAADYDLRGGDQSLSQEQIHPIISREVDIDGMDDDIEGESRYVPLIQLIDDTKADEYQGTPANDVHNQVGETEDEWFHYEDGEIKGEDQSTDDNTYIDYDINDFPKFTDVESVLAQELHNDDEQDSYKDSYYIDANDQEREEDTDEKLDEAEEEEQSSGYDYGYIDYNVNDFPKFTDVENVLAQVLHNDDEQDSYKDSYYMDAKDQESEEYTDENDKEWSLPDELKSDIQDDIKEEENVEATHSTTLPTTTVSTAQASTSQIDVHSTTSSTTTTSTSSMTTAPTTSSASSITTTATGDSTKKKHKGSRKNKGEGKKKTKGNKKGKDIETRAVLDGAIYADTDDAVSSQMDVAERAATLSDSGPACSEPRILSHEDAVIEILLFDRVVTTLNSPHIGVHGYVMRMMPPPPNPDVINNAVAIMFMFSKPFVMTGIYLGNNLNEQEYAGLQGATTTLRSFWVQVAENDDPDSAWKTLGKNSVPTVYHVRAGMVRFDTPITVQVLKLYPQMWDDQPMISSPLMEGCRMHKKQPGRGNKTNSTTKNGH